MLRRLRLSVISVALVFSGLTIELALRMDFHWVTLLFVLVVVVVVVVAYFEEFGNAHISLINHRIGGQLTLWLTGLLTAGVMLVAGVRGECLADFHIDCLTSYFLRITRYDSIPKSTSISLHTSRHSSQIENFGPRISFVPFFVEAPKACRIGVLCMKEQNEQFRFLSVVSSCGGWSGCSTRLLN
jgi:hypothetical protein